MRISGEIEFERPERRWAKRHAARAPAGFRERGRSRTAVEVVDLSTHGCRIEVSGPLVTGQRTWISLPTLQGWEARIVWAEGGVAGLDFVQPLHPAVADLIVRRSAA
jgi:hypothetical protein